MINVVSVSKPPCPFIMFAKTKARGAGSFIEIVNKVGPFHPIQRERHPAFCKVYMGHAVFYPMEVSGKITSAVERSLHPDLYLFALYSNKISFLFKRPVEAGGGHLEYIGLVKNIIDLYEVFNFSTHPGTVVYGDAALFVDIDAEDPSTLFREIFNIHQLDSHVLEDRFDKSCHSLDRCLDMRDSHIDFSVPKTAKIGRARIFQ